MPIVEESQEAEVVDTKRPMRAFTVMWTGQAASLFGSGLVRFALVWWLTLTTGSATVLALATIMALVPQILLTPIAGTYVDRWNRRIVMMVADSAIAASIGVLALIYLLGLAEVWHIYLIMFVGECFGAFHWPAMTAATTMLVPKKHLARVGGMNQTLNGVISVFSPPAGALLYIIMPMQGILSIDILTAVIAVGALFFIRIPQPPKTGSEAKSSVWGDMMAGLRYLTNWKGALMLMVIAMLLNLFFAPAFGLMPILVSNHFGGSAPMLALVESAVGIGTVIGGTILSIWGGTKRRVATAIAGIVLAGLATLLTGLTPAGQFFFALTMLFAVGFLLPIANGCIIAVFQTTIPPGMQGRVFALISSGAGAMMPIGFAIAGPLADIFGVQLWFIVAGVVTILVSSMCFFVPAIMRIEETAERMRTSEEGTIKSEFVEASESGLRHAEE